jgi:L-ribulose-5-phosphate 3-epimerase
MTEDPVFGCIGDELAPDLATQLAMVSSTGWSGIELRSIDGRLIADLTDSEFASAASEIAASGIRVLAVDSNIGGWGRSIGTPFARDIRELDTLASRVLRLGAKRIRIMSWQNDGRSPAAWRVVALRRVASLARRAESCGIELVHENCAGWGGVGPGHAIQLLEHAASPSLRLLFDTGNGLTYGYAATSYLAPILHAVAHVHIKDGRRDQGSVLYVEPGSS